MKKDKSKQIRDHLFCIEIHSLKKEKSKYEDELAKTGIIDEKMEKYLYEKYIEIMKNYVNNLDKNEINFIAAKIEEEYNFSFKKFSNNA